MIFNPALLDGRIRPVFIRINGERKLAVSDGKGNLYRLPDLYVDSYIKYITKDNFLNPNDYEYERGLSGMDF